MHRPSLRRPTPVSLPVMIPCSRVAVFALALLGGCAGAPVPGPDRLIGEPATAAPAWVAAGISSAHPDDRWLQKVGSAEIGASEAAARERAEFDARAGLVRNLSSKVTAASELRELFQSQDDEAHLRVDFAQTVEVVGEGTLEGARPVDFFVDRPNHTAYCLLVLERGPASQALARRVEQKEADAAALLVRAKSAAPAAALLSLCEAYDSVVAARVLRASYAVLAGRPLAGRDAIGDDVLATLRALTAELTLRVESGQGQRGRVGEGLPEPFTFQLVGPEQRGVDGVELTFALRGAAKAELSAPAQTTVAGGAATVSVRRIGASGLRSNQIECRVAPLSQRGLPGPSTVAEYLLPSAADIRVLVGTRVLVFDEAADATPLHAGLSAALGTADFAVVAPSTVADRVDTDAVCDMSASELCRRLSGAVDWVVRVHGSARDSVARSDRMRARASADVTLIDVATGKIDRFVSDPVDGLGDTHERAAATSLERLGSVLGGTVVTRLRQRVGL
ncbi:MAG: hypothetical protein R3F56_17805 [Planctomycetota bacterium]